MGHSPLGIEARRNNVANKCQAFAYLCIGVWVLGVGCWVMGVGCWVMDGGLEMDKRDGRE